LREQAGLNVSEGQEIERLFAMLAEVRQFNQVEKIRESLPELDKSLATFDLPNGAGHDRWPNASAGVPIQHGTLGSTIALVLSPGLWRPAGYLRTFIDVA